MRGAGPAALLLLLAACTPVAPGPSRFAAERCAVHSVIDAASGHSLKGIEDLAPGPDGTLLLAADDRFASEAAIKAGKTPPEGGLYLAALDAVRMGSTRARPLFAPGQVSGGLRPVGIARDGTRLAFVNRRLSAAGTPDPVVVEAELAPDGSARISSIHKGPGFCALNDVALDGPLVLATLSEQCPPRLLDRLLNARRGSLVEIGPEASRTVATDLGFANGVVRLPDGRIAVSETRARQIRLSDGKVIALPGAPDNLSIAPDGRLVVALFPSLPRLIAYRLGWSGAAPARVVAVAPDSGAIETLFDDPGGRLLPGLSGALWLGDTLVAGSVLAEGLLVCKA